MLLFAVLATYILVQFLWWAVLLLRRDAEVARLSAELQALGVEVPGTMDGSRGTRMILGEGAVFLILLLAVLFVTFRAIRRELRVARSQRNFLLAVTHELRTPIAAIKLQLQTLGRASVDGEQQRALREQALTEADRLALLTEKVLLATRADEGDLGLRSEELDVMQLMRNSVDRARVQLAPSHHLMVNGPEELVVRSDADAIRSIVDNLLENAAKYAPPGTSISLEMAQSRDGWRIQVSDEGPGIAKGDELRIFEKFHRSGSEETRPAKGTGLGLYIVDRLVKAMGGTISVQRRQPHGAIFVAAFPKR